MPERPPPTRAILPLWAAVLASLAAGPVLSLAFPALAWWPVVFAAIPLALVSLVGRGAWSALLVGFAFGAVFFFVNLSFTARYLGPVPWTALSSSRRSNVRGASCGPTELNPGHVPIVAEPRCDALASCFPATLKLWAS